MRYQHKPIVIDAEPFYPAKLPWPEGVFITGEKFMIRTPRGLIQVRHGDYIVRNMKGELSVCKKDAFKENFEEVPDAPLPENYEPVRLPG